MRFAAPRVFRCGWYWAGAALALPLLAMLPLGLCAQDEAVRAEPDTAAVQDSVYATSIAMLSLSVRYHYLPIYQR